MKHLKEAKGKYGSTGGTAAKVFYFEDGTLFKNGSISSFFHLFISCESTVIFIFFSLGCLLFWCTTKKTKTVRSIKFHKPLIFRAYDAIYKSSLNSNFLIWIQLSVGWLPLLALMLLSHDGMSFFCFVCSPNNFPTQLLSNAEGF